MSRVSTSFKKSIEANKPQRWPGITRSFKNMQVFGKFKQPLKETLIEPIPSTSSKSLSQSSQQSNSSSVKIDPGLKSSENNESILSSQRINQDTIHCIIMPYWIIDSEKVQQPVLLKVKKVSFIENELVLPFSLYNSNTRNCFQFKVRNIDFHGKIMSLGDNSEELKATFRRNLSANPDWKGLPKMVRMNDCVSKFTHTPLKDKNDFPLYKTLTHTEVKKIFHENIDRNSEINESSKLPNKESQKNKRTQEEIDPKSSSEEENDEGDLIDKNEVHKVSGRKAIKKMNEEQLTNKQKRLRNDALEIDKTKTESIMDKINSQINEIIQKKSIISGSETNGQVLISIINILDNLREFLDQNQQNVLANANIVPEKDSTYKLSQKNQIFIEGLIQLDLDLYEAASKHAKANNPASFAYSLVKFSFPRSYIQDVVLGKKFYEKSEFDEMLKSKEDENRKYPLSFIWGFKDPFNERMEGNFDYKLGNERIRAFINHTFRKSNIFSYSKEAESHVRRRIMKELCFLNAEISRKKSKEDIEDQESESEKSQESMIWDDNWFDKNDH